MVSQNGFGPSRRAFLSVASIGAHSGAKAVRDIATRDDDVVGRSARLPLRRQSGRPPE